MFLFKASTSSFVNFEFSKDNDITFVEGAGGILAPATDDMLCADLIKYLNIPVIIVTVPFLGRLNHTLLTVHYAKTNNIPLKGIIVNRMPAKTDNLATNNFIKELNMYTDIPVIGRICEVNSYEKKFIIQNFSEIIKQL